MMSDNINKASSGMGCYGNQMANACCYNFEQSTGDIACDGYHKYKGCTEGATHFCFLNLLQHTHKMWMNNLSPGQSESVALHTWIAVGCICGSTWEGTVGI